MTIAMEMVRVLDISDQLKEHITDMIIEADKRAALARFNENLFDIFGYTDRHNRAILRLEARPHVPGDKLILTGTNVIVYPYVTPYFLDTFSAGYSCLAEEGEIELLVKAPKEVPQYARFLIALEGWKGQQYF